ncbi:MAG: ABC transporter ATP-binding protein [Bacteroidota bacterium]
MIHLQNISKKYEDKVVLNIEDLQIPKGQSFGLVGNNGAGKTTMFSLLLDLIKPTSGHITNQEIQVNKSTSWKEFTSSYIDESFLIGYLTPDEYFDFIASLRGVNKTDLKEFLEQFEELFNGEILGVNKYLRDLSKGNQKKAGIVATLIGNPEVIILDEPFANLDPSTQFRLKNILKTLNENKEVTILISSHDLNHVTEVCERIVVLEKGCMVKDMNRSEGALQELEEFFKVE